MEIGRLLRLTWLPLFTSLTFACVASSHHSSTHEVKSEINHMDHELKKIQEEVKQKAGCSATDPRNCHH